MIVINELSKEFNSLMMVNDWCPWFTASDLLNSYPTTSFPCKHLMALKLGIKGAPEEPSSNDDSLQQQSNSLTFLDKLFVSQRQCVNNTRNILLSLWFSTLITSRIIYFCNVVCLLEVFVYFIWINVFVFYGCIFFLP